MVALRRGRYKARIADTAGDVERAQRLRQRVFRGGEGLDTDVFDPACVHFLVEEVATDRLV